MGSGSRSGSAALRHPEPPDNNREDIRDSSMSGTAAYGRISTRLAVRFSRVAKAQTRLSPFLVLANAVLGESERFPVELRFRVARPQLGGASAAPPRTPHRGG